MYKCQPCEYTTNDKTNIKNHNSSLRHFELTKNRPKDFKYTCEVCNFRCYFKSQYEVHIKTKKHKNRITPPKLLKCHLCGYTSFQKQYITNHISRIHYKRKKDLKVIKIKATRENKESLENNDYVNDRDLLQNEISKIILRLKEENKDPNKHFNYGYYCSQNINLSLDELNDFYSELKTIQ